MANGQKQDGSIVTAEIADGAVTTPKIANQAVTTGKIADGAVTYAKMQDVSATDRLLGRVSSGSGDVEEVVLDTDTTLAADSDDRVSTQKAVKAYVDAAVSGGGSAPLMPIGAGITAAIGTTYAGFGGAGAGQISPYCSMFPCPSAGNYYISVLIKVYTVSGSPTAFTFKTHGSQTLDKVSSGGSNSTLIAANTTLGSNNKGSAYVAGDIIRIKSSSAYALSLGDIIVSGGSAANIPLGGNVTGSTNIAGFYCTYANK